MILRRWYRRVSRKCKGSSLVIICTLRMKRVIIKISIQNQMKTTYNHNSINTPPTQSTTSASTHQPSDIPNRPSVKATLITSNNSSNRKSQSINIITIHIKNWAITNLNTTMWTWMLTCWTVWILLENTLGMMLQQINKNYKLKSHNLLYQSKSPTWSVSMPGKIILTLWLKLRKNYLLPNDHYIKRFFVY